jgi:hypothetical protein
MTFFVIFVLMGLIMGTGTMLAPAIPSREPRIAASGIFSFGVVLSGSIFWGATFGWDTLVVDYLWFAVIVGIFLGGTLGVGMKRVEDAAEEAGEDEDAAMGWPGPLPLAIFFVWFMVVSFAFFNVDVEHLLVDDDGLLERIEALQDSNDFSIVEDVSTDQSPGFSAMLSYLDKQLDVRSTELLRGAFITFYVTLFWLLYDLGLTLNGNHHTVWLFPLGAVTGLIVFPENYLVLLGANFVLAFWIFALRWSRTTLTFDGFAAAVCAAAGILSYPLTIGPLVLIYLGIGLFMGLRQYREPGQSRQLLQSWGKGLVVIPMLTLMGLSPWLINL